jgi:hypothetical protein
MCLGPSQGLTQAGTAQASAYTVATQQAATEFGAGDKAFNDVMSAMTPILEAGPGQMGETAPQASNINAQTIDTTAAAYKNAAAAVKEGIGAQGGGNVALPSGANLGTEEALAEAGAQQESSALQTNLIQNENLGRQNWGTAASAVENAPGMFSTANQATSAATGAGAASSTTQQAISAQQNQWAQVAMGALSDVATVASGGLSGYMQGVGKSNG